MFKINLKCKIVEMTECYSVRVKGKVQGVGFRFYTQKTAKELGVRGFVKNMPNGSVYIEAEADPDSMEVFINWVNKGPEWARVDSVSLQKKPQEGFVDFMIK